jgi:hypothetical protein
MTIDQPDMFGEAHARRSDPHTSKDAAKTISGTRAKQLERKTYAAFLTEPIRGLINDDLVAITGEDWNAITPRVAPLRRYGYLVRRPDPDNPKKWQSRMGSKRKWQQIHWAVRKAVAKEVQSNDPGGNDRPQQQAVAAVRRT